MISKTLAVWLVVGVYSSSAQVTIPSSDQSAKLGQTVFGLGLSAGLVSGLGLSFRHHFPTEFSYQIVAGIVKADDKLHYNLGSEIQFDLIRSDKTRFFACGGLGYFYSGVSGRNDLAGPFLSGLGIGVEKGGTQALNLSGELLFSFFSDGTILPLPQVSMHYYFF